MHYIFRNCDKVIAVVRLIAQSVPTLIKGHDALDVTKIRSYQAPGIGGCP